VQDAVVAANHEVLQLRATAGALRDSLELERADKARSVQAALRDAADEIQQLRSTIAALRETVEGKPRGN
jgi:phage shock protein A